MSSSKLVYTIIQRIFSDIFCIAIQKDHDRAGSGRWRLWKTTLKVIKDHPFFGCGPDMVHYRLEDYGVMREMPHNEYLQHAADLGIPGLLLYLGALFSLFIHQLKRIQTIPAYSIIAGCAVIAYAVSSFFGVTITIILPFFYILLAFTKGNFE